MKVCNNSDDVPKSHHWAIIEFITVHIPGDERSRTAPGHGYPAHDDHHCNYFAFDSKQEWEREAVTRHARRAHYGETRFVAIEVAAVASFQTEVKLAFDSLNPPTSTLTPK